MTKARNSLGLVWLTLVAFVVQLGIAVAHRHHDIDRELGFAARSTTAAICAPDNKRTCNPNGDRTAHHDGCMLCWAAAIASNALEPPLLAKLPEPALIVAARVDGDDSAPLNRFHRDHFRARAPPLADVA